LGLRIERIAEADPPTSFDDPFDHLVVNRLVDQQTRTGDAGLPTRREYTGDDAVDRCILVGILEDELGRLTAQLEGNPGQPPGSCLRHLTTDPGGAGEGDLVHSGMIDQGLAEARPLPGDYVEHARGQ